MSRGTLQSSRKQVAMLVVLFIFLIGYIFSPALKSLAIGRFRNGIVRTETLITNIPTGWLTSVQSTAITAWKPTWTVFSAEPSAIISISTPVWIPEDIGLWEKAWISTVVERGYREKPAQVVEGKAGSFHCIEAVDTKNYNRSICSCIATGPRISAGFDGVRSELGSFYAVIRRTRNIESKE